MKKIVGLFLVMLIGSTSLFAQDGRRGNRGMDHKERTEKMIKDLNLNDNQATEFRSIENRYMERMNADRENWTRDESNLDQEVRRADMEKNREKMDALRNEKNGEVQKILTEEQYTRYLEQQMPVRGERPNRK